MDPETREKRGRSFGPVAEAYERARPGYPADVVGWLVGDDPLDVVDLGAGTGKLTRSLVALGHRVTAVEPLPEMIAQLRTAVPGVTTLEGGAEAIPLESACADAVVAAQAFHWFDHDPALREIARVLRPGGRIGLVWNMRDEAEAWVAALSEVMVERTEFVAGTTELIDGSGLYGPVERAVFGPHHQEVDREVLRELVLSRSYCAVLSDEERAPVLENVDRLFDEHARDGVVRLPYLAECFRAVRL